MATTPVPALIAPPDFPALSDRASGTYNSKAFAWAEAMQDTTGPNIHALAVTAKANADDAAANATLADADRVQTGLDRVATAADRVQTGLDRVQTGADRTAAAASAVQASKLNLGSKSSPPTLDNQGAALLGGAIYYDTALNKWRVWTGVAWGDGISAVAGVSSLNGLTGDVAGIATVAGLATKQATLVSGTNLKTINGASLLGSGDMVVGSGTYHNKLVTQSSATFVVPAGTYKIRAYAGGKGGDGRSGLYPTGAGSGGGFAFGDITTTPGESLTVNITAGVAKVSRGATDLLTANPGNNGSSTVNVAGGTASINGSVSNGGAYAGGIGLRDASNYPGGGSAGSPLGAGFSGGIYGGGGGIGGIGGDDNGGGAGGAATAGGPGGAGGPSAPGTAKQQGPGRVIPFSDPLLAHCISAAGYSNGTPAVFAAGPGAGGSGSAGNGPGGAGGFGGGGGTGSPANLTRGGSGGELGGGGSSRGDYTYSIGGSSLACGGGGAGQAVGGAGGPATVWIYY